MVRMAVKNLLVVEKVLLILKKGKHKSGWVKKHEKKTNSCITNFYLTSLHLLLRVLTGVEQYKRETMFEKDTMRNPFFGC